MCLNMYMNVLNCNVLMSRKVGDKIQSITISMLRYSEEFCQIKAKR